MKSGLERYKVMVTVKSLKMYFKHPIRLLVRLGRYSFLKYMNDEQYLTMLFKDATGYSLNLANPKTFNEKLQWQKINIHKQEYTRLVDKYEVKQWISEHIGEQYVIPTLGVWDSYNEIDFETLPEQFVLKCTHDSGGLVICREKAKLNKREMKKRFTKALKRNYFWGGREWPYKNVKPRILAEQYIEDNESDKGLTDYKFFCFNGEAKLLYVSRGLENHATAEISFYDMNGNKMPFSRNDYRPIKGKITFPDNFKEMVNTANKLAHLIGAPFVRIDLYSISGKIKFSEVTFFPCGGMLPFEPKEWDRELGNWINLP